MLEGHDTRIMYVRLRPSGQSVGVECRVTRVKSPIRMEKLVKRGYKFLSGTDSVQNVGGRSQCDVGRWEEFSLGGRQSLPKLMQDLLHQSWMGYLKNYRQALARPHQALRQLAHRGSSAQYLDRSSPVARVTSTSVGAQKHKCGAVYLREKRLNVDTWTKRHCWTDKT